jgi:hypothetical protein
MQTCTLIRLMMQAAFAVVMSAVDATATCMRGTAATLRVARVLCTALRRAVRADDALL